LFLPQLRLQRATGFNRPFSDAISYSATLRTYFASSAWAHEWMLTIVKRWNEVLFPGFVASLGGVLGFVGGRRDGGWRRDAAILYGALAALSFWASLGPGAGLYRVLHALLPPFSLMRAPSRFGVLVALALSVLAGLAISALVARGRIGRRATLAIAAFAAFELAAPVSFSPVPAAEPAYRVLAALPRGPVLELPFYSHRFAAARTQYMLNSTAHWMPLVNGYSSHTPSDFIENTPVLAEFPSRAAFRILERDRVKYAVFHLYAFSPAALASLNARLREFDDELVRRYADDRIWLYEIVGYPG
jgi:hypothetical protein